MGNGLTVTVSPEFYKRLRRVQAQALADLRGAVQTEAAAILAQSQALVPRDTGTLSTSTFLDGPVLSGKRPSVIATCGYTDDKASAVHEGFHWSKQRVKEPSNFLRTPAKGRKRAFKYVVARVIEATVSRNNTKE